MRACVGSPDPTLKAGSGGVSLQSQSAEAATGCSSLASYLILLGKFQPSERRCLKNKADSAEAMILEVVL